MKSFLKSLPFVSGIHASYSRWRYDRARQIRNALAKRDGICVVQIGSNDGKTDDPIYSLLMENQSWKALLVEPVPLLFDRLRSNYPDGKRFLFENVAVSESAGLLPFYHISPAAKEANAGLPFWYDQIGSFDRQHINRHFGAELDQFVTTINVPTLRLPELLERNGIEAIELFHIDTEGYDWIVLQQLDLKRYAPSVILFEHRHLSPADRSAACRFLRTRL